MPVIIRAKLLKDSPLSPPLEATFDEQGGTIGRSGANTLALPDPKRRVSRLHAEVLFRPPTASHPSGQYVLRNVGSANPVVHNTKTLRPGETAALAPADQLTIGGYELTVDFVRPRAKVPFPMAMHGLEDWSSMPKPRTVKPSLSDLPPSGGALFAASHAEPEGNDLLWRSLCDGAGIPATHPQPLTPELMHTLGATLRQAVEGTLQLINLRTAPKQEARAQVTTTLTKLHNPLKFAPDAATATRQLLSPAARGSMSAPKAMNEAMIELMGHTLGTMAAIQVAIRALLEHFEPTQLESRLTRDDLLDKLLPGQHQARMWALYLKHHACITQDAQEDFHHAFGRTFVKTYEAECDRLRAKLQPIGG